MGKPSVIPAAQLRAEPDRAMPAKSTVTIASSFTGPLPPPDVFDGFEKVLPGSAERILKMAELEQTHRHQIETRGAESFNKETLRGQVFAFLIALATVAGGVIAGVMGAQWTGSFIGTGGLIGLVTAFIVGRRRSSTKLPNNAP